MASDAGLSFAVSRLLGGLAFSLGLILVVVAGAELFTGNNQTQAERATKFVTTLSTALTPSFTSMKSGK